MPRSLHIGINSYRSQPLQGCVNDANDWAKFFKSRGFGDQVVLLDQRATKLAILEAIRAKLKATAANDSIVITYSGHGTWVPDRNGDESDRRDEAWCPYDFDRGNLILDDELADLVSKSKLPDTRLFIISDSCHSGTMTRAFADPAIRGRQSARFIPPLALPEVTRDAYMVTSALDDGAVRLRRERAYASNVVMFSGCGDLEFSYDAWFNNRPNGAFTANAIKLAQRGATLAAWFDRIRGVLPSPQFTQTPQLTGRALASSWSL